MSLATWDYTVLPAKAAIRHKYPALTPEADTLFTYHGRMEG